MSSTGGSVVECSPATRAARVRFPASAFFFKSFEYLLNLINLKRILFLSLYAVNFHRNNKSHVLRYILYGNQNFNCKLNLDFDFLRLTFEHFLLNFLHN